jgi:hypothetical protein
MAKSPIFLVFLAAVSAASAPPDNLGKRTATPAQTLSGMNQADPEAEQQRLIAAAAAFPLGSIDNPVRVGGPEGERAYLARLRCADGSIPRIGAARPGGNGAFGNVVDLFTLDCGNAAPGRSVLLVDIYDEEHVENQAPPGFTIVGR